MAIRMFQVLEHDSDVTCINSFINKDEIWEVPLTEGFDLMASIQSVYPLLNIVFSKLLHDDLMSCLLVNKCWKDAALSELKKRNRISWVILDRPNCKPSAPAILKSSWNFQYASSTAAFYLYNNNMLQLDKFVCSHSAKSKTRMTFKQFIQDELSSKYLKHYCFLSARNISSTYFTKPRFPEFESTNMLAAAFLPEIPGIRLKMFKCNSRNIKREIPCLIKSNEFFRCVLPFTFSHRSTTTAISRLVSFACDHIGNGKQLAIGGGILDSISMNIEERIYRKTDLSFISFLQDSQVTDCTFEAYSIVLEESREDELRKTLAKFRSQVKCKAESILFKFNCYDRKDKNKEDGILKEYFGRSILLGMDVNGEIGMNNIDINTRCQINSKFYHGYTTVLVLISW